MKLKYSLMTVALLGVGGILTWALLPAPSNSPPSAEAVQQPLISPAEPSAQNVAAPLPASNSSPQALPAQSVPLPASFAGTEIDGRLSLDSDGHLLVEPEVRELFDYFLASIGEESINASTERLQNYINAQLPEPARSEAQQLLSQYLTYKSQLVDLEKRLPQITSLEGLRQREEATRALREQVFAKQAHQAFFESEEQYNQFTLERLTVQNNDQLSDADKADRLGQLRAQLPEELQVAANIQLQQELHRQTEVLQQRGGSSIELQNLRTQLVGSEAAQRLAELDERRSQWQQRLSDYQKEQQRLATRSDLSEQGKAQALNEYAQNHFDERERLRLETALSAQK